MSKTLIFDPTKNQLLASDGIFISLEKAVNESFWKELPWSNDEFKKIHLADLPCRLERNSLMLALRKFSDLGAEDALMKVRIPHPRHDEFLKNIFYQTALLPETFAELDLRTSTTGTAVKLGVNFEVLETAYELDPHWQNSVDQGKVTYKDIELISQQASNVVAYVRIDLVIHKSNWVQTKNSVLTDAMKTQLQEQIDMHVSRGNHDAAQVIRKYLAG